MVRFSTSDQKTVDVAEEVVRQSVLIKELLDDVGKENTLNVVPLPMVTSKIFEKIVEFMVHQSEKSNSGGDDDDDDSNKTLDDWEEDFFNTCDDDTLLELLSASNYLDFPLLVDFAAKTFAERLKGKTVQEMRDMLHVENDLTEEEIRTIQEEHNWILECC